MKIKTDWRRITDTLMFYAALFFACLAILSVAGFMLTDSLIYWKWAVWSIVGLIFCGAYAVVTAVSEWIDR